LNRPLIEDSIAKASALLEDVPAPDRQHLEGAMAALRAYLAFFAGDMGAAIGQSNQALEGLSPGEDLLRGMILFILGSALLQDGQYQPAVEVFQRAIPLNQKAGNLLITIWIIHSLALVMISSGRLGEAEGQLRRAIQLATLPDGRELPVACLGYSPLAEIALERNRLEEAERYAWKALRLSQMTGVDGFEMEACLGLWAILSARGDSAKAGAHLERAQELVSRMGYTETQHLVLRMQVQAALSRGEIERAEALLERSFDFTAISRLERAAREIAALDLRLAKASAHPGAADLEAVIARYQELLSETDQNGQMLRSIGLTIALAQAYALQGRRTWAIKMLERALAESASEGLVRPFFGQPAVLALLGEIKPGGKQYAFARQVLAEMGGEEVPAARQTEDALVEPLSERELEVLRWMARGLSGPEIARELIVAPSTVKTHTKNIFQKLGAHSRYEAVENARKIGLL
jgi:LuxR family transcriptional regulator, maltose regulon positive regulatory protein